MVITGAKSEELARSAGRKFAKILIKLGFNNVKFKVLRHPVGTLLTFKDFKVQNIVASADVHFPVRLGALREEHNRFATYETELFPGLIYRLVEPKVVLLIFVSGKIVITGLIAFYSCQYFVGAKSKNDIISAFDLIYPVLQQFRKQ